VLEIACECLSQRLERALESRRNSMT